MKVAIVHYWLVSMRGGEKVLEQFCEMYPDADIFTHVYDPEAVSNTIRSHNVYETFIAKLPFAKRLYQKYLPLMPMALEALDLTAYDLVISSESGPAKGVITRPDALHVCYCHSPMRYIWDQYHVYRKSAGWFTKLVMPLMAFWLRQWDTASASRPDLIIANSNFVAKRVLKFWGRKAEVVHPPVDLEAFTPVDPSEVQEFYLYVGELVDYKGVNLMVDAFNQNGLPLIVIGDGAEKAALERKAKPNVKFLGRTAFDELKWHYARCKALIFPGVEDFGIVPLEAIASGRPVVAYGRGGALETVVDGETGVFFHEPTIDSLNDALSLTDKLRMRPIQHENFSSQITTILQSKTGIGKRI